MLVFYFGPVHIFNVFNNVDDPAALGIAKCG